MAGLQRQLQKSTGNVEDMIRIIKSSRAALHRRDFINVLGNFGVEADQSPSNPGLILTNTQNKRVAHLPRSGPKEMSANHMVNILSPLVRP